MGKTIKKNQNQTSGKKFVGIMGGHYVVNGKTFSIAHASSEAIAEAMAASGYRNGARVRWNGSQYRLTSDHFGDVSLERVA